jgi:hypothetical protein
VSFTAWNAVQVGTHATRCSTALSGDVIPANDTLSGTVTVRSVFRGWVIDVGVTAIVAPTGTVDSGAAITPQARVRNYGTDAASFPVTMSIGTGYANTQTVGTDAASFPVTMSIVTGYTDTQIVTNLAPGDSVEVRFADWTAAPRGPLAVRCSTALANDQNHGNDTLSGSVTVRVTNVGVTAIAAPTGTVDSGATITPQARVRNYGTGPASFPVIFRIGSFYSDSQNVANLAPGDSALVAFTTWNVVQRGTFATRCSTALSGDQNRANDAVSGSVTVQGRGVKDIGVVGIIAPADTVDSGTVVTPQAWVRNFGTTVATFPATMLIGTGYTNTQSVTSLAPGDSVEVSFADWTAAPCGPLAVRCSTGLAGDQNYANDTLSGTVTVLVKEVKDIGVVGINKPAGTYGPRQIVTPTATVRNYGNVPVGFEVWMLFTDPTGALYYSDSVNVANLDPANNLVVDAFRPCTLRLLGDWTAKCSTVLSGDANLVNNVLTGGFKTSSQWVEMKSMPEPPSYRPVKDGAWLAYDAGSGLIYAGKGNKSGDFYSYDILDNDWTSLRAIPLGLEGKLPRRGACAVSDGSRYVYMAKGNNTIGFWRYDIATDSWLQLASVPAGAHRKVKAGSAVYVQVGDSGYVYLLKGPTTEFYRFNVTKWTWEMMQPAPMGSHSKWYGGSFLTFDGDHTIYAHKARYHELWAYDTKTGTWSGTRLNGMPFVGKSSRSRKSRDGGAGAFFEGGVYALKGGSTSEFWRYDATVGIWMEYDSLPPMASSGKVRKVHAGGSMVSVDGTLFALKGNRTNELWRYGLAFATAPQQPSREGVMAAQTTVRDRQLAISPNPLASGFAMLRCSLPKAGSATLEVFNASGRLVHSSFGIRNSEFRLDLRSMPAGVYLVKVTTEGFSTTQKLVVEH